MLHSPLVLLALLAPALTPPVADAQQASEPLFLDLSIDAGMERAQQENKLLMLFWTVSWEPECRRLEMTTWKDDQVRAWCRDKAVPVLVDGEDDLTLAGRFNVKAYPSVLFIRPDGHEAARMVGYFTPDDFLRTARVELIGREHGASKPEGERAEDPMAWISYANTIFRDPQQATEACRAYLWALDHGEEHEPGFRRRHFEFLVRRIASLKQKTEIARAGLFDRRDGIARAMVEGTADEHAPAELVSFNYWLRRQTNSLLVYDQLAGKGERQAELRAALFDLIIDDLAAHRRYADILEATGEPEAYVGRVAAEFRAAEERASGEDGEASDASLTAAAQEARARLVTHAVNVYEALLASGRGADAAKVADVLLEAVPTGHVHAQLMQRASRLEMWKLVDEIAERGRASLTADSGLDRLETAYRNHAAPERRQELAADPTDPPETQRELKRRLRQAGEKASRGESGEGDDGGDGSGG